MPLKGTKRGQNKCNAHSHLRSGNFFPLRTGGRTAPVRAAAALEGTGKRKGWKQREEREEEVLQQPHSFDPFAPSQVRGVPVCRWDTKGGLTEEAGGRNTEESSLVRRDRVGEKEPQSSLPSPSSREWHPCPERQEWGGSGGFRCPGGRREGKAGPCGPQVFTGECAPDRATE